MAYTMSARFRDDHARLLAQQMTAARHAEAMITHHVVSLRAAGCPWSEIAPLLDCTRQAASQRYGWIDVGRYMSEYELGRCGGPCDCPGTLDA